MASHSIIFWILLFVLCLNEIVSRDVMISTGIGGYTHEQLWSQFLAIKTYKNIGIVTTLSVLAYEIQGNGTLRAYHTNDTIWTSETYQQYVGEKLGLKSIPCIYCDTTIGTCPNLSEGLKMLYTNNTIATQFINDTLERALLYGYDGYIIDFEGTDSLNQTLLTEFLISWNYILNTNDMTLTIWIGGSSPYDLPLLFNSGSINLITMDTYYQPYTQFILTAGQLQVSVIDSAHLGFGILTDYNFPKQMRYPEYVNLDDNSNYISADDMINITNWCILTKTNTLSLWASHVPPDWYMALVNFVNTK